MNNRTGAKTGWIVAWLGGFIWVFILSVMFFVQEKMAEGIAGLTLGCIAVGLVFWAAPWRYAGTAYWRLMIPVYAILFVSILWALRSLGGVGELGLNWWNVFWILPVLLPFATTGRKRWNDFDV